MTYMAGENKNLKKKSIIFKLLLFTFFLTFRFLNIKLIICVCGETGGRDREE